MSGGTFQNLVPIPLTVRPHACALPTHGEVVAAGGGGEGTRWVCDTCEAVWSIRPGHGITTLVAVRVDSTAYHGANFRMLHREPADWIDPVGELPTPKPKPSKRFLPTTEQARAWIHFTRHGRP